MKYSKKYQRWLIELSGLAIEFDFKMKPNEYYIGWYNAGYSPDDIANNIDQIHNPSHP